MPKHSKALGRSMNPDKLDLLIVMMKRVVTGYDMNGTFQ